MFNDIIQNVTFLVSKPECDISEYGIFSFKTKMSFSNLKIWMSFQLNWTRIWLQSFHQVCWKVSSIWLDQLERFQSIILDISVELRENSPPSELGAWNNDYNKESENNPKGKKICTSSHKVVKKDAPLLFLVKELCNGKNSVPTCNWNSNTPSSVILSYFSQLH